MSPSLRKRQAFNDNNNGNGNNGYAGVSVEKKIQSRGQRIVIDYTGYKMH